MKTITKQRNWLLAVIMLIALTAFAAVTAIAAGDAYAAQERGGYFDVDIINATPANLTLDASNRFGNDNNDTSVQPYADAKNWKSLSIGKNKDVGVSTGSGTLNVTDFVTLEFPEIKDGYVPVAVWAEEDQAKKFLDAAAPDFRKWLWDYMQYLTEKDKQAGDDSNVSGYASPNTWQQDSSGKYTGMSFTGQGAGMGLPRQYRDGSAEKLPKLYLVAGAVPFEDGAITVSMDCGQPVKIGNNFTYQNRWVFKAKITNNASYPVYINSLMDFDFRGDIPYGFALDAANIPGGTVLIPSAQSHTFTFEVRPEYRVPGTASYLFDRVFNTGATVGTTVTVENVTHAYGKGSAAENNIISMDAEMFFPGEQASLYPENLDKAKGVFRSSPSSVSPGMIGVTNFTDYSTLDITIKGTNMDRVQRVAMILRPGASGYLNSYFAGAGSALKNRVFVFAKDKSSFGPADAATTALAGSMPNVIAFKERTPGKLVFSINSGHLPKEVRDWINTDTNKYAMNVMLSYFDIYLLHPDESELVIGYNRLTGRDFPRGPDFAVPISAESNAGSIGLTSNGKVGGDYLAAVHSSFAGDVPYSSGLEVSSAATAMQLYYAAIRFTGGSVSKNGANTWAIAAPCKINDYLDVRPTLAGGGVYMSASGRNIEIWSQNCELYAGSVRIMGNFTAKITETNNYWWHSNYRTAEIYKSNGLGAVADSDAGLLRKIKLVPSTPGDAASVDYGIIKGSVTHVYPYKDQAGIGIKATVLGLIPDFITDNGIGDYLTDGIDIDEFRVPYSDLSAMPALSFAEPLEISIGGNFFVFEAGITVLFDINTLPETEQPYLSIAGTVNLFNKLQAEAELLFRMYDGELMPDVIYFAAGSDAIGLFPPVPVIELSKIGGGIYDLGKTFGKSGWNYVPPVNIRLTVSAEINLYLFGLGVDDASLNIGPSLFQLSAGEISVKNLTILKDLTMGASWDFSKSVRVTDSLYISVPVVEFFASGVVDLGIKGTNLSIIQGMGDIKVTMRSDRFLELLVRDMEQLVPAVKNGFIEQLRKWNESPGKNDVQLSAIFDDILRAIKNNGSSFEKNIASYSGIIEFQGTLRGRIVIPNSVPVIGGHTIAAGTASVSSVDSFIVVRASGKISVLGIEGSFTFYFDVLNGTYGFGEPSRKSAAYDIGGLPVMGADALNTQTEAVNAVGLAFAPAALKTENTFTVEAGDEMLFLNIYADAPTAVTLTPNGGGLSAIHLSDALADVEQEINGWIELDDGTYMYTYVFNGAGGHGGSGTVWTVAGDITRFEVLGYSSPALEKIEGFGFTYDGGLSGGFTLDGAEDGCAYSAVIGLIPDADYHGGYGGWETVLRDIEVNAGGTTYFEIGAALLRKFQSGEYRLALTIIKTDADGSSSEIADYKVSGGKFVYSNPLTPGAVSGVTCEYTGNGSTRIDAAHADANGYLVTLLDDSGGRLTVLVGGVNTYPYESMEYSGREIVFTVSDNLPAGNYTIIVAAFVYADAESQFKIYGAAAQFNIVLAAAAPARAQLKEGSVFSSLGEGSYIAAAAPDEKEIAFEAAGAFTSFKITYEFPGTGRQTRTFTSAGELADFSIRFPLAEGFYYVEIETVNGHDTYSARFIFEIDGTPPKLTVAEERLMFDGSSLTAEGYLEPGCELLEIGGVAVNNTGGGVIYERDGEGLLTGGFSFSGNINIQGEVHEYGDGTVCVFYTIELRATDRAGNITVVRLVFIIDGGEGGEGITDLASLSLSVSAGLRLSVGMEGVTVSASLVMTAFMTEFRLDNGALTFSSSDTSVLTVDEYGKLTIKGAGRVSVTISYMGYTSSISLEILERLPISVEISGTGDDSITFTLGAMPAFGGEIVVYAKVGGEYKEVLRLTGGFDAAQSFTVSGLPSASGIDFRFVPDALYEAANAYASTAGAVEMTGDENNDDDGSDDNGGKPLSGGAIAGIIIGSVVVAGLGGFAIFWFVIKKKSFSDLIAVFKRGGDKS